MTAEPLNQYSEICKIAIKSSSAKLGKTFENPLLLTWILNWSAAHQKLVWSFDIKGWFYKLALLDFELIFEVKMQESEGV